MILEIPLKAQLDLVKTAQIEFIIISNSYQFRLN